MRHELRRAVHEMAHEAGEGGLTMAEYIGREATLKEVESAIMWGCTAVGLYEVIENIPATDVVPVRRGQWEIVVGSNGKEYMACTCCRVSQDLTGVFTYCPNCGCRMDGGDDE